MEIINIGDAKTNLSKLVEQVLKGEEVIIGRETNHWYAYLLSIKHEHTNVPCNCQISIKTHLTRFKLPRQSAYAKHGKNKLLNYILEKGLTEENFIQIDYEGRKILFNGEPLPDERKVIKQNTGKLPEQYSSESDIKKLGK